MALGPYHTTTVDGQTFDTLRELKLDGLIKQQNSPIANGLNVTAGLAEDLVNLRLFNDNPFVSIPYQSDTTAVSTTMAAGVKLFLEYGSTGNSTMDFTTNGGKSVIVLGKSAAMNFNDLGSATSKDIIIGSNVNQYIQTNQGNNFVVAGNAETTLVGGAGKDTLVGGGETSILGGSGAESIVGGAGSASNDTLMGGSGPDTITTSKGDNLIIAGSGTDSIYSSDKGSGAHAGGDSISLVGGGNALVSIGGGTANDSVYFGGTKGDDTLVAKGNVELLVQTTEVLKTLETTGGKTELTFQDGQTLTYSGTGHVTVTFSAF